MKYIVSFSPLPFCFDDQVSRKHTGESTISWWLAYIWPSNFTLHSSTRRFLPTWDGLGFSVGNQRVIHLCERWCFRATESRNRYCLRTQSRAIMQQRIVSYVLTQWKTHVNYVSIHSYSFYRQLLIGDYCSQLSSKLFGIFNNPRFLKIYDKKSMRSWQKPYPSSRF